jgi:hypothetical protein
VGPIRYFLQLSILLAVLGTSAAFGADRSRLAQTQTASALPPPQLLPQAGTCAITCDSVAMNCLNTCVGLGPASPANPQCSLSCTTQQLICKQRC